QLGGSAIKESIKRAGIEGKDIQEVMMGNVVSAGLGQNPARRAMIFAGLPYEIGAFTINKVCGSGLKAVMIAADAIKSGSYGIIVAGGMENMNQCPYLLTKARYGYRLFNGELVDAMVHDGLWDIHNDFHMGLTGEIVAERFNITREEMDALACESHLKAAKATEEGRFKDEILPLEIPQRKGDPIIFDKDEGVRPDTTRERLGKLKPVFKKDGMVTAGNASQISDGASALVVMAKSEAEKRGVEPLARVVAYNTSGLEPEHVMSAPIPSVKALLKDNGFTIDDIDIFEHNEAFASASVAVRREIGVPDEKFNVNGGAVALGHPIGCSGARVLTTLLYAMKDRNAGRGLATLCLGGGNAVSMIVEM
ncbi:MAG: acetyl-CoA C-acetyltransferase, partial [Candidatus Thermoplasmatota archaeon]|nr:acetyl-CoA C-acetyltransferase [Candidatus Thermoplasmatota archaeon]